MYKKGQMLVAKYTQYGSCGESKLNMDSIVKAASDEESGTISIFYTKNLEKRNVMVKFVKTESLREAKPEEVALWEAGIHNCKGELI